MTWTGSRSWSCRCTRSPTTTARKGCAPGSPPRLPGSPAPPAAAGHTGAGTRRAAARRRPPAARALRQPPAARRAADQLPLRRRRPRHHHRRAAARRGRRRRRRLSPDGSRRRAAVLRNRFGSRVADLFLDVTNPEYPPGTDRHRQYREHVIPSLTASPWARLIKASDFTDNGVGIIHTRGPKAVKLARKYAPLVPALTDLIARPTRLWHPRSRHASSPSSSPPRNGSPPSPGQRETARAAMADPCSRVSHRRGRSTSCPATAAAPGAAPVNGEPARRDHPAWLSSVSPVRNCSSWPQA